MPRAARFSRQLGNARENRFGALLEARGYVAFYSRGSRGTDIIALCREGFRPHLLVAISRPTYSSVREPFQKLRDHPTVAGSRLLLAREMKKAGRPDWWRVYVSEDSFFDDVDAALEAARGEAA